MWPDFTTLSPKEPNSCAVLDGSFVVQQCDEVEDFTTPCPEMSCVTTLQLVWWWCDQDKDFTTFCPGAS